MFQHFKMPFSFGRAEERNWRVVQDSFLHVLKCFIYIYIYVLKISVPVFCLFNTKSVVMLEFTPHTNHYYFILWFLFISLAIIVGFGFVFLNKGIPFLLLLPALSVLAACSCSLQALLLYWQECDIKWRRTFLQE